MFLPGEEEITKRAQQYAIKRKMSLEDRLGWGQDGFVFQSSKRTAVKTFGSQQQYEQERAVYERLRDGGVTKIRQFSVPRLVFHDSFLLVIEMEIVTPPYVLDFAAAHLDGSPYSTQETARWQRRCQSRFGERWPEVAGLIAAFARYGIILGDIHPNNVNFGDDEDTASDDDWEAEDDLGLGWDEEA